MIQIFSTFLWNLTPNSRAWYKNQEYWKSSGLDHLNLGIFRDTYETEKGRHTELISWFYKGYKSVKVVTTPLQQLLQSCFVFASRLRRLSYQRWVGWEYNAFLHISIHRRRNFSVFELKQKEKAGQQICDNKRSVQINWESKRLTWIFTL